MPGYDSQEAQKKHLENENRKAQERIREKEREVRRLRELIAREEGRRREE